LNRTQAGAAYLIYGKAAFNATSLMATSTLSTTTTSSKIMTILSNIEESTTQTTELTNQLTPARTASGGSGTVISAAVGGIAGGLALAGCLAAVGFYAYRKKSGANQSSNPASNNDSVALQDKNSVSTRSNYGRIDELKKNEKEYDDVPKLEI
jgi:hypothetical protein